MKDWALTGWKDKRKVMQRYNVTAEIYDERYAQEQERKYKKALENVNVVGKTVLDVGCGSGLFFKEVAIASTIFYSLFLFAQCRVKASRFFP